MTQAERIRLLAQICDALHHAHANGVIHRDLSSANILMDEHRQPKLVDFGIARLLAPDTQTWKTELGQCFGTLPYMSPEQVLGQNDRVDERSDVYSLGVIAFEVIVGNLPYDVQKMFITEASRVITETDAPRIPSHGDIGYVLAKALAKQPDERYQSALEFRDELYRILDCEPVLARRLEFWYRLRKILRRHPRASIATVFIVCLIFFTVSTISIALVRVRAAERLHESQLERYRETLGGFCEELFQLESQVGFAGMRPLLERLVADLEAQLELDNGDPQIKSWLAHTLYCQGNILHASEPKSFQALSLMEKALKLRRELVEQQPDQVSYATPLSQSLARVGDMMRELGNSERADAFHREAFEKDRELVQKFPENMELREDLGWSRERLCHIHLNSNQLEQAEKIGRRRFQEAALLVQRDPHNWKLQLNLAEAHGQMAVLAGRRQEDDAAFSHKLERLRILRMLLKWQPKRRLFLEKTALACRELTRCCQDRRNVELARTLYWDSYRYATLLIQSDPGILRNVTIVMNASRDLIQFESSQGRPEIADEVAVRLRGAAAFSRHTFADQTEVDRLVVASCLAPLWLSPGQPAVQLRKATRLLEPVCREFHEGSRLPDLVALIHGLKTESSIEVISSLLEHLALNASEDVARALVIATRFVLPQARTNGRFLRAAQLCMAQPVAAEESQKTPRAK